jgi:hypothetical protein
VNTPKTKAILAGVAAAALTVGTTTFAFGDFSPTGGAGGSGGSAGSEQGSSQGGDLGSSQGTVTSGAVVGSGTNAIFTRFNVKANTGTNADAQGKNSNAGSNGGPGGRGGRSKNKFH